VHCADGSVGDGRILPIETAGVSLDSRVVERSLEWQIGCCGNAAGGIGDDQRQA
jgi:hypothetical protein